MLKNAGFDHIIIEGRSEHPVYLRIFDDQVELVDAAESLGPECGRDMCRGMGYVWISDRRAVHRASRREPSSFLDGLH